MTKAIPIFDQPDETREIAGLSCRVRRLPATKAPAVISRIVTEFGSLVAEYLCTKTPEELLETAEGLNEASKESMMLLGTQAIKLVVASEAFAKIHEQFKRGEFVNIDWYLRALLPGSLELNGVAIDTIEELDATGAGPLVLGELLLFALEVNFDPGFGGRDTSHGTSDHRTPQSQDSPAPSPAPESSNDGDESPKMTGRGARRRAKGSSTGTSGGRSSKG